MMAARRLTAAGLAVMVIAVVACSPSPDIAHPSAPSVTESPGAESFAPAQSPQPVDALTDALLRQLGLGPALGIVLSADPAEIPLPKEGQYLSGLGDFELTNQSTRSAWILPNETVFHWTGSTWDRIGCAEDPLGVEDRYGFCEGGVEVKNELPAGAVANGRTEPIGFYISWPMTAHPPTEPRLGFYAFVLPVWDNEQDAASEPPMSAAVLVVELVEDP